MSNDLPKPNCRNEQFLNAIAKGDPTGLPVPKSRTEKFLAFIAENGTRESLTQDQKDKLNSIDKVKTELETLKSLKTVEIVDGVLQLTEDRNQYCVMEDFTEILLPVIDKNHLEIQLKFNTINNNFSLMFPECKMHSELSFKTGESYTIIFEKVMEEWRCGGVIYA